jgi:thiol-disulfide isomerase/thioredoxin
MATAKKPKSAVAAARRTQKQPPWLWIGVGVLVLALAAAAIISSGGDDDDSSGNAAGVVETRSVSVTGAPLPQFPRDSSADPGVGKEIPDVTGQSFDGTPVSITKDGKPKLILFVAHWCPHCQKEVPLLADYLKDNPLQGVDLYTVSTSVQKNQPNYPPSAWLEEEGWTGPTLADSDDSNLADAFGLSSFPYFVAVDASGKVAARTSGELTTDQFAALAAQARG